MTCGKYLQTSVRIDWTIIPRLYFRKLQCNSCAENLLAKLPWLFSNYKTVSRTMCMHVKDSLNLKRTKGLACEVNKLYKKEATFHLTQEFVPI